MHHVARLAKLFIWLHILLLHKIFSYITLLIQVRHLELKREKEVERSYIIKFLQEAMANQFKNPLIWN